MLQSLKNNSALVSKTKGLKRLREQLKNASSPKRNLHKTDIDPTELKEIKHEIIERYRRERRRNNVIISILSAFLVSMFLGFLAVIFKLPLPEKSPDISLNILTNQGEQKEEVARLNFYIEDGYKWLGKNQFDKAYHQFKLAIDEFPNSYDAQLGLLKTYEKQCELQSIRCDLVNTQRNKIKENVAEKLK